MNSYKKYNNLDSYANLIMLLLVANYNINNWTSIFNNDQIKLDKIRLNIYKEQLRRYNCISEDGSQIYKLFY